MNLLLSDTHCLYVYKPIKFPIVFCFKVFHGCIFENENDSDGIKEVLKVLHKFVPYAGDENRIYAEQGNVGDQLSVERAVNCMLQLSNGFTPEERLDGLHFECGDFHGGMKFLQVINNFSIVSKIG